MAKIVLGIGTSHGPMLSTPPDQWGQRVAADKKREHWFKGRSYSFDQLVALRADEKLEDQITQTKWNERHAACRKAIATLAAVFADTKPDIAVIVGNDQMEMFTAGTIPAMSVYMGREIPNEFPTKEELAAMPPGIPIAVPGNIPPEGATYEGLPALARHLIDQAISDSFDVASVEKLPPNGKRAIPHAFGFVYRQIMNDMPVPSVPVLLNTFYPPNQPTVGRCYDFGRSLVRAIQSWDDDLRVALVASGGLSHFVVDEEVDEAVMDALRNRTIEDVAALGEPIFQAGTSECKNWVPVAGAMADLGYRPTVVDYVPCYRSIAGTGNAMGFVYWRA